MRRNNEIFDQLENRCSVDDIGEMALVGRDILNLYRVEFDAPNEVFAIY
jgi:hypothetical protein